MISLVLYKPLVCCIRFCSVKEDAFWRNYFYRVSLIKQSAQLTALAAQQQASEKKEEETSSGSPENDRLAGSIPACPLAHAPFTLNLYPD